VKIIEASLMWPNLDFTTRGTDATPLPSNVRGKELRKEQMQPELQNSVNSLSFPCPVCGEVCTSQQWGRTLVGYFSPAGHDHDDNCRDFIFEHCGKRFGVRPRNTCPTTGCDWKGKDSCSVCGNWLYLEEAK
jgi:hypothetical protein